MKLPDKHCEQCQYYKMIDSAYGYCIGQPPTVIPTIPWWEKFLTWISFYHYVYNNNRSDYPFEGYMIVSWDTYGCRVFIKRK